MLPRCGFRACAKTTVAASCVIQLLYVLLTVVYWGQDKRFDEKVTPIPSLEMTTAEPINDTLEYFLWLYEEYCRQEFRPRQSNVAAWSRRTGRDGANTSFCPCVSDRLVGALNRTAEVPLIGDLELRHRELWPGGEWFPTHCIPLQRIAIIIPYRDRDEHLAFLLSVLHPMLQRQMLHYTIYVIEQLHPEVFNKAALMNAGVREIERVAKFDCYIFHDVDMIPLHDHNFYTCTEMPRHIGSHVDKFNFTLPYTQLFGGVTGFTPGQFDQVNGYSNLYYGWGGEDDDMFSRIAAQNLSIIRFSSTVARYSMIQHTRDDLNPDNRGRFSILYNRQRFAIYQKDGVRSVRYMLNSFEARPLYTWLQMSLPPHPRYFQNTYLMHHGGAVGGHSMDVVVTLSILVAALAFCVF